MGLALRRVRIIGKTEQKMLRFQQVSKGIILFSEDWCINLEGRTLEELCIHCNSFRTFHHLEYWGLNPGTPAC